MYFFRNGKIESGIVYQYYHIRVPFTDIPETQACASEYGADMGDNRPEAHVCKFTVMLDQVSSGALHHVAAKTAELRRVIPLCQSFHQIGSMKVSRRLPGHKIVFHSIQFADVKISIIFPYIGFLH